jgi:hypothetical protein
MLRASPYQVWRYDPYYYCLALLLERFTFFLEQRNAVGDVLAESRGGKEDMEGFCGTFSSFKV